MVSEIQLHKILIKSFSSEEAERIIDEVKAITDQKFEDRKDFFTTKADLTSLSSKEELSQFKSETKEEFRSVREEFKSVRKEIRNVEVRLVRQIYATSIIQILAIIGSILGILKAVGVL